MLVRALMLCMLVILMGQFLPYLMLPASTLYASAWSQQDDVEPQIQEMIDKMIRDLDPSVDNLYWTIKETDEINAQIGPWKDGFLLIINRGLINVSDNPDQLAGIVGHELAHLVLGHFERPDSRTHSVDNERYADLVGAVLMMRAGYNVCEISKFWKKMSRIHPRQPVITHPNAEMRTEYMACEKFKRALILTNPLNNFDVTRSLEYVSY